MLGDAAFWVPKDRFSSYLHASKGVKDVRHMVRLAYRHYLSMTHTFELSVTLVGRGMQHLSRRSAESQHWLVWQK